MLGAPARAIAAIAIATGRPETRRHAVTRRRLATVKASAGIATAGPRTWTEAPVEIKTLARARTANPSTGARAAWESSGNARPSVVAAPKPSNAMTRKKT